MSAFSLTIEMSALELIRDAVNSSGIPVPVVQFIGMSGRMKVAPEWGKAFFAGTDSESLGKLFREHHGNEAKFARKRIVPAVLPRDGFPADSIIEASGFTFVLWPSLAARINGGSLEVGTDGGLVLKNINGEIVDPI
jgi:hypothetical protein